MSENQSEESEPLNDKEETNEFDQLENQEQKQSNSVNNESEQNTVEEDGSSSESFVKINTYESSEFKIIDDLSSEKHE